MDDFEGGEVLRAALEKRSAPASPLGASAGGGGHGEAGPGR
ncbi:hypothetical protein [Streptomyces sp. ODS05-4]|nr:hypothetical protein [Streptomyces sp. ODS05-4]